MNAVIPSEEQVVEWITSLSNWGRWGEEDQAGCLNLITPEKRRQAAALIRDGTTVSCARPHHHRDHAGRHLPGTALYGR
jgi:hypothetical protein